jgi:hypothetical protein
MRISLPYSRRNPSPPFRAAFTSAIYESQVLHSGWPHQPPGLNELVRIWQEPNGTGKTTEPISALLAVDVVVFHTTATVDELGKVESIQGTDHVEYMDLCDHFMIDPVAFQDFVKDNFDHAYTSLSVYQIQPFDCKLTCCIVHIDPAANGKENYETVVGLQSISEIAGSSISKIIGYIFDGDSHFSGLHIECRETWDLQYRVSGFAKMVTSDALLPLAVTDPLHILKRIRYRLLSGDQRVSADERIEPSTITKMKAAIKLPGIVLTILEPVKCTILSCCSFSLMKRFWLRSAFWKIE